MLQDTPILRPLDPGEAFFYMSDHVSCMNFVVFAERVGHLEPQRIRRALDLVQQGNQLLQASISWTQAHGLCFNRAPYVAIEMRCHDVCAQDWQHRIDQQLSEPFAEGAVPLMRCLYLPMQSPERSVLALCFHHAIGDGRSGTELLRQVLNLIAADSAPIEAAASTVLPAMAEVFPKRYRWTEQADAAKQLKAALIGDYRRHGAHAPIPWLTPETAGRAPKFIRLSLSAEATQQLIAKARAHGTSVHGALCAAQLLAQFNLHSGSDPAAFFLSCPVDMRAHLEPVQPVTPTGLFVSIVSGTFPVSADTDFWTLAHDIITQTRLQISRGEGHLFFNMYGLDGSQIAPSRLESFRKKTLSSLPHTMVSNIGQVATVAADPAVESISFALCPMPYQTLFTAASTYLDQLTLNVGYDAARLTEPTAQALVQSMRDVLLVAGA